MARQISWLTLTSERFGNEPNCNESCIKMGDNKTPGRRQRVSRAKEKSRRAGDSVKEGSAKNGREGPLWGGWPKASGACLPAIWKSRCKVTSLSRRAIPFCGKRCVSRRRAAGRRQQPHLRHH